MSAGEGPERLVETRDQCRGGHRDERPEREVRRCDEEMRAVSAAATRVQHPVATLVACGEKRPRAGRDREGHSCRLAEDRVARIDGNGASNETDRAVEQFALGACAVCKETCCGAANAPAGKVTAMPSRRRTALRSSPTVVDDDVCPAQLATRTTTISTARQRRINAVPPRPRDFQCTPLIGPQRFRCGHNRPTSVAAGAETDVGDRSAVREAVRVLGRVAAPLR